MLSDWSRGVVLDFFELKRGFDITARQAISGEVPVYSSAGVSYYHNKALADGPGVVIGRKGSVGSIHYVDQSFWPHDTTLWVRDFKGNVPKYVFYYLHSLNLVRFDEASSVPTLNRNNVHNKPCCFPPAPEQNKIVEVIETWDEAIGACKRLISTKQSRVKALSRRLFEPCHPKSATRPDDWARFELGDVFSERDEQGREDDRLLSITMAGGVIDRDDVGRRDVSNHDKSSYKLILPGDLGYNTMRMWQGVCGLSQLRGIVSPAYTIVTPDNRYIDARYAAHLFKSRRMVFDFERYSQGLTSDTWNLKFPAFSKIVVHLPPIRLQKQQAALMDALLCEIDVLERQRNGLAKQKRGLMQKLLTGEWRVKTKEKG
ncbi:MAG: restriction endonuclease subunit S [Hyphomicrobium sp.]|uniref:restriction endonuclease subunit S n=1 Tax=Hyphomicrobium sp. TaxID=82 RepID=UPI0025B84497|nr:restriction endonuclease subunit S [Hyphomicrobium sp.]MBX9864809.1 restriction endonuclease subunit S [Hyphomicrobium sp.]